MAIAFLGSLALFAIGTTWKPIATFYLLPTRAWELLFGSMGALWLLRDATREPDYVSRLVRILFIPSLLCLLAVPFFPIEGRQPGPNAILACTGTIVVILKNSAWLNTQLLTKAMGRIGDVSYSLYLVHWPMIAFTNSAWVGSGELPIGIKFAILLSSCLLAYVLFRYVEDPIRRMSVHKVLRASTGAGAMSVGLMLLAPMALFGREQEIDFKELRRVNYGLSHECAYNSSSFVPRAVCQTGREPSMLVWGDSYAMHLVPGLVKVWKGGVIQATRSQCGPILGLASRHISKPEEGELRDLTWAKSCISFNESVIAYLDATPSIEVVVMSSPFRQYVTRQNHQYVVREGDGVASMEVTPSIGKVAIERTVQRIRSMGKKVIVVAPPPSANFNIGGCVERLLSGTIAFGGQPNCEIDISQYLALRADVVTLLRDVQEHADIGVIWFDPWLCDSRACITKWGSTMLYRDAGHLSYAGSELLAEKMGLGELIKRLSR